MSRKILVVEDNARLSKFLAQKVKSEGFELILAQNGEDGLIKARAEKPDLILLDLVMPVMDGLTMLKELRQESQVPVIALTNLSDDYTIKEVRAAGANLYLVKVNYSLDEVMEEINKIIK